MSIMLECNKLKRTALLSSILFGGLLSAAFPILNLLARADSFVKLPNPPLEVLVNSNWAMMSMLNSFLMILATCIIYHIEFSNNAIQRMDSLPILPSKLFLNKFILLGCIFAIIFLIEGASLLLCTWKWFHITDGFYIGLIKFVAYSYLLSLPVLSIMLAVSSVCKNMWTTVGVGVIGIFASQILNSAKVLKYFPFLMPYQSSLGKGAAPGTTFCIVAVLETILFIAIGIVLSKVRRNAQ